MRYGVQPDQAIPVDRASPAWSLDRLLASIAASSGLAGVWLALHYPVWPWAMAAAFVVACVAFWKYPSSWLVVLPALLPLIGFAPWTGWITFEEVDLLVLAVAAGGYARLSVSRARLGGGASVRAAHAITRGSSASAPAATGARPSRRRPAWGDPLASITS